MGTVINLECRMKGHQTLCTESAELLPEGGGYYHHNHVCHRCGTEKRWPTTELEPHFEQMLRMTVRPSGSRITVDLAGSAHARPH